MSPSENEVSSGDTGKNEIKKYAQHVGGILNRWGQISPAAVTLAAIRWIKSSPLATRWMRKLIETRVAKATEELRGTVDVLLVLEHDGWLDCYAKPYVRVHAYSPPPLMSPRFGELHIEYQMPQRVREMFVPGMHPSTGGKVASFHLRPYRVCRGRGLETIYSWWNCARLWPSENEMHLGNHHQDGSGI